MPNRIIKESIRSSDSIDQLSWFEEVLFYRLIVSCDDYGRMDARPTILKTALFPLKENKVSKKQIENAISSLIKVGVVQLYEVDKKPFLFLPKWGDHQRLRNSKEKYPAPSCRELPQVAASCGELPPRARVYENPIQSQSQSNPNSDFADVFKTWEKATASSMTMLVKEDLEALLQEHGKDNLCNAIARASEQGKVSIAYIKGIFRNKDKPKQMPNYECSEDECL